MTDDVLPTVRNKSVLIPSPGGAAEITHRERSTGVGTLQRGGSSIVHKTYFESGGYNFSKYEMFIPSIGGAADSANKKIFERSGYINKAS